MTCIRPILTALLLAACSAEEPAPAATEPYEQAQAPEPAAVNTIAPPAPAAPPAQPKPPQQASDNWRDYANAGDVDRLERLDAAWDTALGGVKEHGHQAELARLGALADRKVALANPHPAPGAYRCRTLKLGRRFGLIAYGWFRCEVELTPGGDLVLNKVSGSQRSFGKLYPGEGNGLVFIGSQAWGMDEAEAPAYGADRLRDQIGVLERVGEQRWRLALPWPRVESDLDLMELAK